ncbi:MAG: PLP-dependent transferase, partial [Alphaproteobacteria bacterium]|nr:PLP-dependent transferase [Alphaproteobacteria bacterium]
QAATKYIVGHSDALLGTITTTKELYEKLRFSISTFGYSVGSEEAYLGARGIRTIGVRLKQHEKNAMKVAKWLQSRPEVSEVLCPALPDDKGHEIWKRDFTGACGLFGVVLKPCSDEAIAKMIDGYKLFSIGLSWGGFESLVLWVKHITRTVTTVPKGSLLRFHIGLEDADDLIDDLEKGFKRLAE